MSGREQQNARVRNDESEKGTPEGQSASDRQASAERQFKKSIERLNKRWEAQQFATAQKTATPQEAVVPLQSSKNNTSEGNGDIKIHKGAESTRRLNGLFAEKHVGPPQLSTIDGEDYLEHPFLTKPGVF